MGASILVLTAVIVLLNPCLQAVENRNEMLSADEVDDAFRQQRRNAAASFRVQAREVRGTLSPAYHQAAAEGLARARQLFVNQRFGDALRAAERSYADYPFADAAPQLAHLLVRLHGATGSPFQARRWLTDLWERYPSYDGIESAMADALTTAVVLRNNGLSINLEAELPSEVFNVRDIRQVLAANDLFRFLSFHGDRQSVAPVAQLNLARSLLAEGGRDQIFEARLAYDDFLITYPQHPLVFEALIESAVSYLVTYRGPRFDVGVLIDAAHIIDQAELYTQERPERVAIVRHYRRLIRGWHQERDFYAAEWYRDHRHWQAARYYYEWVVNREASTELGQQAAAALQDLPSDTVPEPSMRIIDWIRR